MAATLFAVCWTLNSSISYVRRALDAPAARIVEVSLDRAAAAAARHYKATSTLVQLCDSTNSKPCCGLYSSSLAVTPVAAAFTSVVPAAVLLFTGVSAQALRVATLHTTATALIRAFTTSSPTCPQPVVGAHVSACHLPPLFTPLFYQGRYAESLQGRCFTGRLLLLAHSRAHLSGQYFRCPHPTRACAHLKRWVAIHQADKRNPEALCPQPQRSQPTSQVTSTRQAAAAHTAPARCFGQLHDGHGCLFAFAGTRNLPCQPHAAAHACTWWQWHPKHI